MVFGAILDCHKRQEPGQSSGYDHKCPCYVKQVSRGRKGTVNRRRETVENKEHHKRAAERKIKMSEEGLYDVNHYRIKPYNPRVNSSLEPTICLVKTGGSSGNATIVRGIKDPRIGQFMSINRTALLNCGDNEPERKLRSIDLIFDHFSYRRGNEDSIKIHSSQ
jgi:hypothetical protein